MELIKNSKINYWLKSRTYDLSLLHFSIFTGCISLLVYYKWGIGATFLIYIAQSFLAGGPHVYLSLVTLASKATLKKMDLCPIGVIILFSVLFALLIVIYRGQLLSDIILSITFFLASWHSYRQHYGLSKIYDYVLSNRTGDFSFKDDLKPLYIFYGLVMNFPIIYAFSLPHIPYIIARGWTINLWYPKISEEIFLSYMGISLLIGLWAFKRSVYDRIRSNKIFPLPQFLLMGLTMAVNVTLYLILPPDAYMLIWIIPTLGHNIQYFGFVWMFERKKITILNQEQIQPDGALRLVERNKWPFYFGITYLVTAIVIAMSFLAGQQNFAIFVTFATVIFHYLGDGFLWKRSVNRFVVPVSKSLI